jgi:hypothetical protein
VTPQRVVMLGNHGPQRLDEVTIRGGWGPQSPPHSHREKNQVAWSKYITDFNLCYLIHSKEKDRYTQPREVLESFESVVSRCLSIVSGEYPPCDDLTAGGGHRNVFVEKGRLVYLRKEQESTNEMPTLCLIFRYYLLYK